ncbi:hypothetical protein Poly51_35050 [Rubripirellula tenax]|uniref:Uncharacterized protein n=1 Tax=Rubripirellula tenax TaxID=2528015 RepID=A0A5C6F442_9BACT|nr:hypothetical protein [Rubripirellula tenax]TWU54786.1 hypothetical protein Poly51_35050 [Rubripirellula tenax]
MAVLQTMLSDFQTPAVRRNDVEQTCRTVVDKVTTATTATDDRLRGFAIDARIQLQAIEHLCYAGSADAKEPGQFSPR